MTPFTSEIKPQGQTLREQHDSLVQQLANQNRQLREIIDELQREVIKLTKGNKNNGA